MQSPGFHRQHLTRLVWWPMAVISALGRKITRPVYIVNLRLAWHTCDSKEAEEEGMEAAATSCWNHSCLLTYLTLPLPSGKLQVTAGGLPT